MTDYQETGLIGLHFCRWYLYAYKS